MSEEVAHQFLQARLQPKKKSLEATEVTEIQLSSEKKIIVASAKKRKSSQRPDEEVALAGRNLSKTLEAQAMLELEQEVAELEEDRAALLPIAADDEGDSQEELFAPLQNKRRPKRRNNKPNQQPHSIEKAVNDNLDHQI